MKKSINRRITIYFLIIMVFTAVFSTAWNYYRTSQSILKSEREQSAGCARAVTALLNHYGDTVEDDWSSEKYIFLWQAARNLCRGFGLETMYIYTIDAQTDRHRLLIAMDTEDESSMPPEEGPEGVSLPEPLLNELVFDLAAGYENMRRVVWRDPEHHYASMWIVHCPLRDAPYPVYLCMEYSLDRERERILSDFLEDILLPIFALFIAFLVLNLMIRRRVAAPISLISDRMKRFAQNSSERPEPLHISNEDEIGEIAASFESMTEQITAHVRNIEKLTKERVETNVQLEVARRIQYGLVPEKTALNDRTFSISAMTRPAKAVGGDFYDCFRKDDGTICIVMGDVSGKGITAAIFMAMIKTIIREKLTLGLSPARALNQTNKELIAQNPELLFATVFAAVLNPCSGDLTYANAGHTYPVLLGRDAGFLKPDEGIALGVFDDAQIPDKTMKLLPGQGILLYTDGLTDALDAQRVPFGMERLLKTLHRVPHGPQAAEEVLLLVSRSVSAHCEGVEPFDDMAALALFMTEALPEDNEDGMRPLPVSLSAFQTVKEAVLEQAGDTKETRMALLACDETLSNIVHHSGAASLSFRCEKQGDMLCLVFSDDGKTFDPTIALTEEKDFDELDSGGMGLQLIRQTVSSVRYERKDERNLLTLTFPV